MISPGFFFFLILIFQVVRGIKGQKMVQNDKKFCLSRFISQEPYIIWLSCMVQMCKMIISPGAFFNFRILVPSCQGTERAKNDAKWWQCLSVKPYISGTISYDVDLWHTCIYKRIISLDIFTFFSLLFKTLIFWNH